MTIVSDVTTQPSSGLNHIDALLENGPGWNWLTPSRSVLYYTFSLAPDNPSGAGQVSGPSAAFNASQQTSTLTALAYLSQLTGITFSATSNGNDADLHFAAVDVLGANTAGLCSWGYHYSSSGNNVVSYTADAWIYLDNVQWASDNNNPAPGTTGYETLLHELAHALGLKHPFEDGVTLPPAKDNTNYTLMSYTHVGGTKSAYGPYDIAALMWLYGGDGLGGQLGQGTSGLFLVGSEVADTLIGGTGNDSFRGEAGNDVVNGGSGTDTAYYNGNRTLYTITPFSGGATVSGPDGTDTLNSVEKLTFADQTVALVAVNTPPTGGVTIVGTLQQGAVLSLNSTIADADGLGALSWRWQSSANGNTWTDIAGATTTTFTPGQALVGRSIRVMASWTDGGGTAETVASSGTPTVANVNDSPTGSVTVSGTAKKGLTLNFSNTLADADGLGVLSWQWQSSPDGSTWNDIAGAISTSFTPDSGQVGLKLRVLARWTDAFGAAETVPSTATATVQNSNQPPTGSVTVGGTGKQGDALTASNTLADPDGLGTIAYRWQSSNNGNDWLAIAGAGSATFTPGQAQVGLRLRVLASYTDALGSAESVPSAGTGPIANVNDPPTGTLTITGTLKQGVLLSANQALADPDGLSTLSLRWQSSVDGAIWADIASAKGSSYVPDQAQVGLKLRVVASWTDGFGSAESFNGTASSVVANVNDAPTGNVSLSGAAEQGATLKASNTLADVDGMGPLAWEWQSSATGKTWSTIAGASSAVFAPGTAQVGQLLRVVARWTDGQGTAESVASAASTAIAGRQTGTEGADQLLGTAFADRLDALAGNDRVTGGGGADQINGGAGIDTAVHARARADYVVTSGATSIKALIGDEGSDTLVDIERLQFSDQSLAFDLGGAAGSTARILGAVFGREAVANKAYAGIGLSLLDGGMSLDALMQLALEARLGVGFSPAAEVQLLYQNLMGTPPAAAELDYWTGTLTTGQFTAVGLAWMAAALPLNDQNIDLIGLAAQGLGYT